MAKLDVEHYLGIYKFRQEMQEEGITNPSEDIKRFTRDFVEKLSKMRLDEEIILEKNSFFDSKKNLIIEFPASENLNFLKTSMPETRKADYYLSYFDYSVFIDFNKDENNLIYLIRISFDGFGCCELEEKSKPLNQEDSVDFINIMNYKYFDQNKLNRIIRKSIELNKNNIWEEALIEYKLT